VGGKIIRQTINQPSISSDLLSNFPLHNEPNCLLEIVSYSLKENTTKVDQFIQGEGTKPYFEMNIPIISRHAFCVLNYSTYYSLYPDIFYHHVMQSCVPDHFGMNPALYNQVQINGDFHTEDKEENISTHDHITSYSNQLSVGELRNDLKGSQIVSSIDSSKIVLKEGFHFYHNQLFEIQHYNQPNIDISGDYSKMLVFPFSSSQVLVILILTIKLGSFYKILSILIQYLILIINIFHL
jgi:hypothetical protein